MPAGTNEEALDRTEGRVAFLPPEVAAEAVAETMSKLADADVLIIDLGRTAAGVRTEWPS